MNVVFDFGNVLFHWDPPALLGRLLPNQVGDGAEAASAAGAWVDRFFEGFDGDWGEFDRGRLDADVLAERIGARTGLPAADARRVIDAVPHELRPDPAMVALLERLRDAGHRLWFLSNMPAAYADHLDATHALIGLFEGGLYSARVGLVKPEPAIFELASRRFALDSAATLFIDDVQRNVAAARAAGWQALWFENAPQCEEAFGRLGLIRDHHGL